MSENEIVTVNCSKEVRDKCRAQADTEGMKFYEWINRALEAALNNARKK